MGYFIFLIVVLVVCGGAYHWRRSRRRPFTPPRVTDEGGIEREVPAYAMSVWIDDQVAERQLYRKPDLSAAELAAELGISAKCLTHIINVTYDRSVAEYLDDRRIQRACRLLGENTGMSMDDVCQEVGFASQRTFQIVFARAMGVSPQQYRSQMSPKC